MNRSGDADSTRLVLRLFGVLVLAVGTLTGTGCSGSSPSDPLQGTGPLEPTELRQAGLQPAEIRLVTRVRKAADARSFGQALTVTDSLIRRIENRPHGYLLRGTIFMELGRIPQARGSFREAIERDSTYAPAHRWMGELLEQEDRPREALRHWRRAARLEPEHAYYRYVLGTLYFKTDQPAKAIDRLEPLVDRRPAHIHTLLGRIHLGRGNHETARRHFRAAIDADSTHADAYYYQSKSLSDVGEYEEALPAARRALKIEPGKIAYRYHLGQALLNAGRTEDGARVLGQVLDRDSTHRGALYNRSRAFRRLGRERHAESLARRLDRLQAIDNRVKSLQIEAQTRREDPQLWLELARELDRAGRTERAFEAYVHAASLVPSNLALANNIANRTIRQGDTTRALGIYQTILRRDSTVTTAWVNLGAVYANLGREEEARSAWERVLELEPGHSTARSYLSRLDGMTPSSASDSVR